MADGWIDISVAAEERHGPLAGGSGAYRASHHALLEAGIWVIEGLNLADIEPGLYDLACMPLKILQADGALARAALRPRLAGDR